MCFSTCTVLLTTLFTFQPKHWFHIHTSMVKPLSLSVLPQAKHLSTKYFQHTITKTHTCTHALYGGTHIAPLDYQQETSFAEQEVLLSNWLGVMQWELYISQSENSYFRGRYKNREAVLLMVRLRVTFVFSLSFSFSLCVCVFPVKWLTVSIFSPFSFIF